MRLTIFLAVLATMFGCSNHQDFGCVDQLKTRVPIGTTLDAAEAAVRACGMESSTDASARILHAVRRGKKKGMTQENRLVVIKFDDAGKVSSIDVRSGFTGP